MTKAIGTEFTMYGFAFDGKVWRSRLAVYVKAADGSRKVRPDYWGDETFKTAKQAQAWSLESNIAEHARVTK
jgi:hypothetical protein